MAGAAAVMAVIQGEQSHYSAVAPSNDACPQEVGVGKWRGWGGNQGSVDASSWGCHVTEEVLPVAPHTHTRTARTSP